MRGVALVCGEEKGAREGEWCAACIEVAAACAQVSGQRPIGTLRAAEIQSGFAR